MSTRLVRHVTSSHSLFSLTCDLIVVVVVEDMNQGFLVSGFK